jgi:hypothetical protein
MLAPQQTTVPPRRPTRLAGLGHIRSPPLRDRGADAGAQSGTGLCRQAAALWRERPASQIES